ncbi:putative Ig domain-containing protein [Pedobacter alpinus]|uniref:Ig domain-containing protein n=1 Tax=Pedobacter alpinus TaxID=1590643 RepID=A0ABW5TUM8_9SPHI
MKKILLLPLFLIAFLLSSFPQQGFAQVTVIDFNSEVSAPNGTEIVKQHSVEGFTFASNLTNQYGVGFYNNMGEGGTRALSDNNVVSGALTRWTISRNGGSEFQFRSIYIQEGGFGSSTSGTIRGYKNGNPTGSAKTINFNGVKDYASDPDFYDVDEIRIEATDIYVAIDNFTYGSVFTGPVNAAPVATAPTAPTVQEDAVAVALADNIQITDVNGDNQSVTFTITGGTVSLGTAGITFGGGGNGSSSFTASGTLTAINTALDAATFTPTPNLFGTNAGSISFVSNDGTVNSNTATVTFNISGVNDDPTFTGLPASVTVVEDAINADLSGALSSGTFNDIDAGSNNVTLTLSVNQGTLNYANPFGTGVNITGPGTSTGTFTGTVQNIETYLNINTNVVYTPPANLSGLNAATLTVSANDNGNTGSGGGQTVVLGQIQINITPVNDAPTDIVLSPTSINENVAANSTVGSLTTTDPDAGNSFTYTLVAGTGNTDNGSFSISGANLRITNSPNFEVKNSYSVRIRTTDQGGLFYEETFTITINNVNETPTDIALSANSINENVAANSQVGTFTTTDPDASNTFTYTLVAGAGSTDNASFNISGSSLRITDSPNFEVKNSYSVRIRTTDQGSLSYEKVFTININNVNDAPIVANAIPNQNATEDQAFNFQFALNTFADMDAGAILTYTAQLNGGGALPLWLSFDGATRTFSGTPLNANVGTVSIDVIANDGSGGTITAIFNIVVGATLPVTFNQYSAKLQTDGTVLLTWDTFAEQSNDYFEISKSTDGQNFVVISTIKGNGTTTQRSLYNYTDRTPKSGDNYYKLVQVDLDGAREDLGIRSAKVALANDSKVTIYPNPSTDLVNIVFESGKFTSIELVDLNGRLVQKKVIATQATEITLEVGDLPSSSYLIKLVGNQETIAKVLVVKR